MDNLYHAAHFNLVQLSGQVAAPPLLSHSNHEEAFYRFFLAVPRLSGQEDTVPVLVPGALLERLPLRTGDPVQLTGQLRSFNSRRADGPRLILSVFAREALPGSGGPVNRIRLGGTICKQPSLRRTPLGREICDIILAVNRRYGRADYLPCIAWGALAHEISHLAVGSSLCLEGRVQSRIYRKLAAGQPEEHTAYEVSMMRPLAPEELPGGAGND